VTARQEDFVFAEHVLRRGFATEEQIQECLGLLERLRGEMNLDETLQALLLKRGYLALAQAKVIEADINPGADTAKNQIEGYQLLTRLGSGAMGSVYKAHHLKLNIPVALKVLRIDLAKSKTQIERLKREAQLAARLNHPNIVRSIDVGESNGFHYFAMEFVDGQTVRQLLHKGRLREKDALRITRDVARALVEAAAHDVVHRDVKPANIILTRTGVVKLADFGLARGQEPSDLTLEHASIGTPQYLAPEQARRAADATSRSDLFSLGATLYHMVTGRPPFSGGNLGEVFQKVLASRFDPPEAVVDDLSLDTVYLIHRLMRANPRQRYASAADLLVDLERIERGERIAPPEFKGDYQTYLRRRQVRNALVGSVAVAVIAAASLFTYQAIAASGRESDRREACLRADKEGARGLDKLNTVTDLEAVLGRMRQARESATCEDHEIPKLQGRIKHVGADIALLGQAEECAKQAEHGDADFRTLHRRVHGLLLAFHLPGPRLESERIGKRIADLSERAAVYRYREVYQRNVHKSREDVLVALAGLAADLRGRFLDLSDEFPWQDQVPKHVRSLQRLIEEWDRAEDNHKAYYEKQRKDHWYKAATMSLDALLRERSEAVEKAVAAGVPHVPSFFPLYDSREKELEDDERAYFELVVRDGVETELKRPDPDAAERLVLRFRPHAKTTVTEVDLLLSRAREARREFAKDQGAAIRMLQGQVVRALADRQYGVASKRVSEARLKKWIPSLREQLDRLYEQSLMYKALRNRFVKQAGVKPDANDLDLFVGKDGKSFTLAKMDHEKLVLMFAFPESETRLRGYFYLAESHAARDPRKEVEYIAVAISDLSRAGDPLVNALREREVVVKAEVDAREKRAETIFGLLRQARKDKDHERAMQHLATLWPDADRRHGLHLTDFVENRTDTLRAWREEAARIVGVGILRKRAGIPERDFKQDPESGLLSFRFDFKEWFPDEGSEPADVKDRRAWLNQRARQYWRRFFEGSPELYPKKDLARLFERAKRGLLWFNGFLVPDRVDGAAVLDSGSRTNYQRWFSWNEDKIRAITLRNPFRADRDWSIELTVSWYGIGDEAGKAGFQVPDYFAITAGEIQAGLLYHRNPHGGGAGARLFRQGELFAGFEKRFYDFHTNVMKQRKKRNRFPKGDGYYVDRFEPGKPYRIRLERKGSHVIYSAAPEEDWKRRGFDASLDIHMKASFNKTTLARAVSMNGDKSFRIVSLQNCRLHEVVIEGIKDAQD